MSATPLRLRVGPSIRAKIIAPAGTLLIVLQQAVYAIMLVRSSSFQESLHGPLICDYLPDASASGQGEIPDYLGCDGSFVLILFVGIVMLDLISVIAMAYLSVRVLRYRVELCGTVLVMQGALKAKRFDLSSAEVDMDALTIRRIPYLRIYDPASGRGRLFLRDVGTPLMPPGDLLALAEAIESGRRPETFVEQATRTATTLRRLATDPVARLSA
ncbi:hypothetical protein [Microbispora catharanthi]|uniref:Uncharacterized protein n=1 Tax=Microbispora catharanthi TaxID=1712871 RepID=A0A5N6C033_9ACTN|nr:hypothetical protein [Microbispora catharanthi]KAB8185793.1 hypothetical protein FH610_008350 [Microbispora catharanthi]